MTMVNIGGKEYFLDGYLLNSLEIYKKRMRKNWDSWIVMSGDEGDGKSHMAKQICSYVTDGKFNIDHIAWTPAQFKECVLKAEQYSAVLYDEAISGLSARKAMSSINNALISMAAQCRKRNLFVVICLPSFFDLDKNIALHRTRGLIHVYANEYERGFFRFYNKEKKTFLYVQGKKFYNMNVCKAQFFGRVGTWDLIDSDEYEKRKDQALEQQNETETKDNKWKVQRDIAWKALEMLRWTHQKIADFNNMNCPYQITKRGVGSALENAFKEGEKMNNINILPRGGGVYD